VSAAAPAAARGPLHEALFLSKALLRNRALAIRRDWEGRSLYGFALVFGTTVFCAILLGTLAGVRVLEAASATALLRSVPCWAFLIYLFTDVLIAFGQALGDLYLSRDMPTLLGLPVRTSSVVVAKFVLGVAQNEVYAVIFLLPFALGYLAGTHAAWWAYPVGIAAVFVFPAILYAVLLVVTIVALRAIPARLAKEGLWLVGASVPTCFWFLSFYRVAHLGGSVSAMRLPPTPDWLPSTWIGNALAQLSSGDTADALRWFGLLAVATFIVCPIAVAVVSRAFSKGWNAAVSTPARRTGSRLGGGSSSPSGAVAGKDLVTFVRSPQLWFNHVAALGFVAYLLVGHGVSTPLLPITVQLAMVQMGFVAVLGALNPGMTALSLEHRGIWILKAAPLLTRDILTAKFGVAYLQTGSIAAIGAAALSSGYGFSLEKTLAVVGFALAASASSVWVGIAFDATYPSFDWDNPNHINRGLRMIVPFLVNLSVLLLCTFVLFGLHAASRHGAAATAAGLVICLGVYAIAAIESMRIARRNLEALEV
jgi:ABC-2 type transport system permease protein